MFSSTIIPTVGRQTLTRAVESVLNQNFDKDQFEVIVVNDSGEPLAENASWQTAKNLQILDTNRRERSFARNTGAAIAQGQYFHFLDDDDWIEPDTLQHFYKLSQISDGKWLYGATQLVDQKDKPLLQLHHGLNGNSFTQVMAGEWIPLQASLIEAESFFAVGGFNQMITGPEDIDLLRRIAMLGELAETSHLVAYIVRHDANSTTDYVHHPEASRWARERIIQDPRAFQQLQDSASSNYWCGRVFRLYLTSMLWNLQRKKVFVALERGVKCAKSLFFAGSNLISSEYWRAITKPYESFTFKKGLQETDITASS